MRNLGQLLLAAIAFFASTGAAQAQLTSTTVYPNVLASSAAQPPASEQPSKAQALDIAAQSRSVTTDVSTAALLLRTMAGPIAPQFVKCDPRTLPGAREMQQEGRPVSPNELVLGQQNRAVVANSVGMVPTVDGTQCPTIGRNMPLAPYFNQVRP